jgi:hypothetical protein
MRARLSLRTTSGKARRATGSSQGVGSEAYSSSTSQGPTPEDDRLPPRLPPGGDYAPEGRAEGSDRRTAIFAVAASDSSNMWVKFKFKFILNKVKKRYLSIFPSSETVFNFKFKLILMQQKTYVNNFFIHFRGHMISVCLASQLGRPSQTTPLPCSRQNLTRRTRFPSPYVPVGVAVTHREVFLFPKMWERR